MSLSCRAVCEECYPDVRPLGPMARATARRACELHNEAVHDGEELAEVKE